MAQGGLTARDGLVGSQVEPMVAATASGLIEPKPLLFFQVNMVNGATQNFDMVIPIQMFICNMFIVKIGGNGAVGDTVQLQTGAGVAITDAVSINVVDTTVIGNVATCDDATNTIAAGGTLRIRRVNGGAGGNTAAAVSVIGFRLA